MSEDLERAITGDRAALGRLLHRQETRLKRAIDERMPELLRERARLSDVLQSGYLQVIRKLTTFRGDSEEAFGAWVARILENRVRERQRFFSAEKRSPPDREPDLLPVRTPSSDASRSEDLRILAEALDELTDDHRRVLELRIVEDLTHEEVAARMGRSPGATRMLLSRARAALALEVEKRDGSG